MPKVNQAVVHPLVLLNCVDHYNRVAKNTSKRVVGVLLGKRVNGDVDITKYVQYKNIPLYIMPFSHIIRAKKHNWPPSHLSTLPTFPTPTLLQLLCGPFRRRSQRPWRLVFRPQLPCYYGYNVSKSWRERIRRRFLFHWTKNTCQRFTIAWINDKILWESSLRHHRRSQRCHRRPCQSLRCCRHSSRRWQRNQTWI